MSRGTYERVRLRFSHDDVAKIRQERMEGVSSKTLAKKHRTSHELIALMTEATEWNGKPLPEYVNARTKRYDKRLTVEDIVEVRKMFGLGEQMQDIKRKYNVDPGTVRKICKLTKYHGQELPKLPNEEDRRTFSERLSYEDVVEIRLRCLNGEKPLTVGRSYNILTFTVIQRLLNETHWHDKVLPACDPHGVRTTPRYTETLSFEEVISIRRLCSEGQSLTRASKSHGIKDMDTARKLLTLTEWQGQPLPEYKEFVCPENPTSDGVVYKPVYGIKTTKYKVGDNGTVWSRGRSSKRPWKQLKSGLLTGGYLGVAIHEDGIGPMTKTIHKLVLEAFVGPKPAEDLECRHLDSNKANNNLSNLCWGTTMENTIDKIANGTWSRKLKDADVIDIRLRYKNGESQQSIMDRYDISKSTAYDITKGNTWKHLLCPNNIPPNAGPNKCE